ncbi:MAG: hypothetical protein HYX76_12095 [Acidobacteria bacterium]|nr:hypothetical protein [Acidobacteriota bacterium]
MTRRAVRVALFILVLGGTGIAGYQVALLQGAVEAERAAFGTFDSLTQKVLLDTERLAAAEQGYVAPGQGEDFWMGKVDELLASISRALDTLRRHALAESAGDALDKASASIESFQQVDRRARDYARTGQKLIAADLIFTDGLEITRAFSGQIESGRRRVMDEASAAEARHTGAQGYWLVGLAASTALVLALLVPVPRRQELELGEATRIEEEELPAAEVDLGRPLRPLPDRLQEPAPTGSAASQDAASAQVLRSVAELCTDLSRVVNAAELPRLLERGAHFLDATGIIVWIADHPGGDLRPVLAHGYPAQALARIQPIPRDADNVTAAAYREGRVEIVRTNGMANGAIAAPLVNAAGCVGVMAAEVRNGAECKSSLQALATIFAAQLAALVTPATTSDTAAVAQSVTHTS